MTYKQYGTTMEWEFSLAHTNIPTDISSGIQPHFDIYIPEKLYIIKVINTENNNTDRKYSFKYAHASD
jgi:hypothetical protein